MLNNISYWDQKNFFSADVIIVDSGIVGLNAAITIRLNRPKISVMILERGFLPAGASTKTQVLLALEACLNSSPKKNQLVQMVCIY